MKIRSALDLERVLAQELAWRKKELSTIKLLAHRRGDPNDQACLQRWAIPALYAHWEGFAKKAATAFLHLVLAEKRTYGELTKNFLALAARGRIKSAVSKVRIGPYLSVVSFLLENDSEVAQFSANVAIDAESNLTSTVLRDILSTIGIPYSQKLELKGLLVDGSLVVLRNDIAHGSRRRVDSATFLQLHSLVIELVDHIRDLVEEHAVSKGYISTPRATSVQS